MDDNLSDIDVGRIDHVPFCPWCYGLELVNNGRKGQKRHFRCRNCGKTHASAIKSLEASIAATLVMFPRPELWPPEPPISSDSVRFWTPNRRSRVRYLK